MTIRLREARSRLAGWSAYFAWLSIPVLVVAAIGHRMGTLEATPTYAVIALGFCLAALAVIAALAAFAAIWRDGRKGAGSALRGLIVGLAVLVLPAIGAWKVVTYPRLDDISTDLVNPPPLTRAASDRGPSDAPIAAPGEDEIALQKEAYPDIVPRHYPVSTARVYQEAKAIVDARGWQLLRAEEPSEGEQAGAIEAVAVTTIFAFRQDVAIRVMPDGDGSLVDMRSAARNAAHDLGADAERVRRFFTDLDAALQGVSGT
ncbi:MAG: DUF1499 domain-containing protein [Bauldia sp.]|nr:DUF1499 domain-containing protein [Bauldia sp.]